MQKITEKWQGRYPNAMKRWDENWDVISPMFKFSAEVRKVIYTTTAIESLNSSLRRLTKQPKKRISKRYSPIEGAVSGDI